MRTYLRLLVSCVCRDFRARHDLMLENLALRQKLAVYARQSQRPHLRDGDRRFWSCLARMWSDSRSALVIVEPHSVVRWHRAAWRSSWTWRSRARRPGRPRIGTELRTSWRASRPRTRGGARFASRVHCSASGTR